MDDIRVLLKVERALAPLEHAGQKRVLAWLTEKAAVGPITASSLVTKKPSSAAAPTASLPGADTASPQHAPSTT